MRIGVIVDGIAELGSLHTQLQKLSVTSGHTYTRVLKADVHPLAPPGAIAKAFQPRWQLLKAKGVDRTLVVLDRESRSDCPGKVAADVASQANALGMTDVVVVLKDQTYENWLLADVDALRVQRARFRLTRGVRRQIEPNRADRVDAIELMKRITVGRYDKVKDAERIMSRASPASIARNSRSFRKFLQSAGDPRYRGQTKEPA